MAIHLVYRSSGRENTKPRPSSYTKCLALASFIRSVDRCHEVGNVVFVNDGPIPRGTLEMMGGAGEILDRTGLNLTCSYREAITLPVTRGWPERRGVHLSPADAP